VVLVVVVVIVVVLCDGDEVAVGLDVGPAAGTFRLLSTGSGGSRSATDK
jgi:hypothetical protein